MTAELDDLVRVLDLEPLELNLFRGQSRNTGGKSIFGGQVLGQALMAASHTVAESLPHSLHGYFLRAGDMDAPIVYDVDRTRDGRHITTRRVQAIQHGLPIFTAIVSFHRSEDGLSHQATMPRVPDPESLIPYRDLYKQWLAKQDSNISSRLSTALSVTLPIEFRPVHNSDPLRPDKHPPEQAIWFRAVGRLRPDPMLHRGILAYASDFNLLSTALLPHGRSLWHPEMIIASIDHVVWFHRDADVNSWLLYVMDSPSAQSARGLSRGMIFSRDGRLVATIAQESLMRVCASGITQD